MRGQRAIAALLGTLGCTGCGTYVEFEPKHPHQADYPRATDVASRVREASKACNSDDRITIGVVHADGDPDDVIPALAKEAADCGGTHYVVEGDKEDVEYRTTGVAHTIGHTTFVSTRTQTDVSRRIWAIVYRCPTSRESGSD